MSEHRPRKRYGQHFLHDANVLHRIIAAIRPQPGDRFVEIGPGHGALTQPLLASGAQVDAIEIDRDLAAALPSRVPSERLQVHLSDALKFDFGQLAGTRLRLVGNLPYNISTPLLFHALASSALFRDIHVMLQKEVVDRMAAVPGSRDYGRLSVALAARCDVEPLFTIRPGSFTPRPQVDSALVRLKPAPERAALIDSQPHFDRLLARAFSMRRKQLANSLKGICSPTRLKALGIDPQRRPETLSADEFIQLANDYARQLPEDAQ
ncbi:MAG TPA: 16S rRNA (adenine(1518)-N(6)/adenine(1519)-N(6))-dimethyltransferase RsmA [Chromatiales bacterium]|nr:16S rRNA (adenine(1518)-N(6)/adenine(1519)-N(6))-dimethyltransferase RsmA [Chromatiales bacterium]